MTKTFARLDENNKVVNIEDVRDEDCQDASNNYSESIGINFLKKSQKWDFWSGVHNKKGTANKGNSYIPDGDYFKDLQPYPSWTFSMSTYTWEAPVAYPDPEHQGPPQRWNEETGEWETPS